MSWLDRKPSKIKNRRLEGERLRRQLREAVRNGRPEAKELTLKALSDLGAERR